MIRHGDCLEVMAGMEPEPVDAIVTDPPYGLEFMGKEWDRLGGAGFHAPKDEGRMFTNASGHMYDNLKALPRYGSVAGAQAFHARWAEAAYRVAMNSAYLLAFGGTRTVHRMTVALEDAGWIIRDMLVWAYASGFPKSKASLKPAWEPIVMARKPGPLRDLAIDACRIGVGERPTYGPHEAPRPGEFDLGATYDGGSTVRGRWPSNVVLTSPIFDGGVEGVVGGGETTSGKMMPTEVRSGERTVFGQDADAGYTTIETYGDSGTYSRFFLVPKASRADREPALTPDWFEGTGHVSTHPTVKPVDLMRHLVRLVTPPGGTVLDPFLGSGTTGIACEMEGFRDGGLRLDRHRERGRVRRHRGSAARGRPEGLRAVRMTDRRTLTRYPSGRCFLGIHVWQPLKHGPSLSPYPDMDARECQRCGRFEVWAYWSFHKGTRGDWENVRPVS